MCRLDPPQRAPLPDVGIVVRDRMIPPDTRLAGSVPCLLRPELAETKHLALDLRVDAGGTETFPLHSQPASKKRRGTKSREGWRPVGRRALWRFDARAGSMGAATLGRGELHACPRERAREREKRLSRLLKRMSGRRARIDCHELGRERSWPAWGEGRGSGRRRAEDAWVMTCRTRSGSAATSARSRGRRPRRRSCGRRSAGMGMRARVAHPV